MAVVGQEEALVREEEVHPLQAIEVWPALLDMDMYYMPIPVEAMEHFSLNENLQWQA